MTAVRRTLRWSLSLGRKLGRVAAWQTASIVLLTLISQIAMLLASFLPLKVVILLGSEGVPRYIPASLAASGKDMLIVWFSVATVGFFVLHLVAEKVIGVLTQLGTERLLSRSQKMVLFENQDELAADAYLRFSRALAAGVFVALAAGGLLVFYPDMAGAVLTYAVAAAILLLARADLKKSFQERLEYRLPQTMGLVAGIGFFSSFAYLVVDFILLSPPGVIVAIVSLLLSRQMFNRLSGFVQDLARLESQHDKIDALFFHGKPLMPSSGREDRTIWPLLRADKRESWVADLLADSGVEVSEPLQPVWHQTGVRGVAGLRVVCGANCYLLKLYESNRTSLAHHEAMLLADAPDRLPALDLIGVTRVLSFQCLVFRLPTGDKPGSPRAVKRASDEVRGALMAVELEPGLLQRYQRSRALLWQRMDRAMLDRLRVAADTDQQRHQLDLFQAHLPRLKQHLRALPLSVMNPDMGAYGLWQPTEEAGPLLLNWGRWAIEPLGAGWGESPKQLEMLGRAIKQAAAVRPGLADVPVVHAELASLAYALESRCARQQFVEALALLDRILERLDAPEDTSSLAAEES
jgi:hypothetical protein